MQSLLLFTYKLAQINRFQQIFIFGDFSNLFSPPPVMTAGAACLSRYVSPTLSADVPPAAEFKVMHKLCRATTGWICLWPHVTKVLDWSGRRRRMWHHNPPHCLEPSSSSSSSGWCLIISVATTLITTWGDDVTGSTRNTPGRGGGGGGPCWQTISSPPLWIAAWKETGKEKREVGQLGL